MNIDRPCARSVLVALGVLLGSCSGFIHVPDDDDECTGAVSSGQQAADAAVQADCEVAAEVCDGRDNDCDGVIDEDSGEGPCQTGARGQCAEGNIEAVVRTGSGARAAAGSSGTEFEILG